jgi:hypothetical protein
MSGGRAEPGQLRRLEAAQRGGALRSIETPLDMEELLQAVVDLLG